MGSMCFHQGGITEYTSNRGKAAAIIRLRLTCAQFAVLHAANGAYSLFLTSHYAADMISGFYNGLVAHSANRIYSAVGAGIGMGCQFAICAAAHFAYGLGSTACATACMRDDRNNLLFDKGLSTI